MVCDYVQTELVQAIAMRAIDIQCITLVDRTKHEL